MKFKTMFPMGTLVRNGLKSPKSIAFKLASRQSIETFLFYCIGIVNCFKLCNTSSRVLNMSQLPFNPIKLQSHTR